MFFRDGRPANPRSITLLDEDSLPHSLSPAPSKVALPHRPKVRTRPLAAPPLRTLPLEPSGARGEILIGQRDLVCSSLVPCRCRPRLHPFLPTSLLLQRPPTPPPPSRPSPALLATLKPTPLRSTSPPPLRRRRTRRRLSLRESSSPRLLCVVTSSSSWEECGSE